jgi:hypothetical protein
MHSVHWALFDLESLLHHTTESHAMADFFATVHGKLQFEKCFPRAASHALKNRTRGFDFFYACHYHNTEGKMMKRKTDKLTKLLILNLLFLALAIVITINLLETGGVRQDGQSAPVAARPAS